MGAKEVEDGGPGLEGFVQERHVSFFRGPPPFVAVTARAGADQVLPGMGAAAMPGDYVIDSEGVRLLAAILTGVIVPPEDLAPGQPDTRPGTPYKVGKPDNRGEWDDVSRAVYLAPPVLDDLRLASEQHADSAASITNVEGLIVLV